MLWKSPPVSVLVPQLDPVGLNDEIAAAAADEVDLGGWMLLLNCSGQTDRLGFVASNYTVFDRDVHALSIARRRRPLKS